MITLSITTFNRSDLTIESFSKVYEHPLISEIVIVDDASETEHWVKLLELIDSHPTTHKIHVYRNEKNLGMSLNKKEAVSKATNEWVILFDSDNVLYPEYLNEITPFFSLNIAGIKANSHLIFCPEKAEPDYDFSKLPKHINRNNAKHLLKEKEFRILLNTCNYLVNRDKYLEVYQYDPSIQESDTIHFNTLWLEAGFAFYIVQGMKYFHRRHSGSGWLLGDHEYNLKKADELQEKIKNL